MDPQGMSISDLRMRSILNIFISGFVSKSSAWEYSFIHDVNGCATGCKL